MCLRTGSGPSAPIQPRRPHAAARSGPPRLAARTPRLGCLQPGTWAARHVPYANVTNTEHMRSTSTKCRHGSLSETILFETMRDEQAARMLGVRADAGHAY